MTPLLLYLNLSLFYLSLSPPLSLSLSLDSLEMVDSSAGPVWLSLPGLSGGNCAGSPASQTPSLPSSPGPHGSRPQPPLSALLLPAVVVVVVVVVVLPREITEVWRSTTDRQPGSGRPHSPPSTALCGIKGLSTARDTAQLNAAQLNKIQHSTNHSRRHSSTRHNLTQYNTAQLNTTQHNTAKHSTAQQSTAQHSTAQHNSAQHSTA